MSMAIGHFAAGVSAACVLLALTGWYRARDAPFLLFAGGIWGMVPDAWRLVPIITHDFHQSGWANLFAGHQLLDAHLDTADTVETSALLVAIMCASLVGLYALRRAHALRRVSSSPHERLAPTDD